MFNLLKGIISLPFNLTGETLCKVAELLDVSEEELVGLIESGELDLEGLIETLNDC